MQNILHSNYYNLGKYLVQARSQAKYISLPEVHGIGKGLDSNILPERQVIKPIVASEVKGMPTIKPRIGQGWAGLRWKIKILMSLLINRPIVKLPENP